MDALRQWIWSDLDDIMVGTWMLCGNGYGLIWTLSWLAHGCSAETTAGTRFSAAKSRKHRKDRCVRCLHVRASTTPRKTRQARRFRLQSPRNTVNTDVVGVCVARMNSTLEPLTRRVGRPKFGRLLETSADSYKQIAGPVVVFDSDNDAHLQIVKQQALKGWILLSSGFRMMAHQGFQPLQVVREVISS